MVWIIITLAAVMITIVIVMAIDVFIFDDDIEDEEYLSDNDFTEVTGVDDDPYDWHNNYQRGR